MSDVKCTSRQRTARVPACTGWSGCDDDSVEFHLPRGELIALLRHSGFEIEEPAELRPARAAMTRFPFVTRDWARRWPSEEVWKVRRAG